eukprot:162422-Chlamydomonas_euryale.AAC.1
MARGRLHAAGERMNEGDEVGGACGAGVLWWCGHRVWGSARLDCGQVWLRPWGLATVAMQPWPCNRGHATVAMQPWPCNRDLTIVACALPITANLPPGNHPTCVAPQLSAVSHACASTPHVSIPHTCSHRTHVLPLLLAAALPSAQLLSSFLSASLADPGAGGSWISNGLPVSVAVVRGCVDEARQYRLRPPLPGCSGFVPQRYNIFGRLPHGWLAARTPGLEEVWP